MSLTSDSLESLLLKLSLHAIASFLCPIKYYKSRYTPKRNNEALAINDA